MLHDIYFGHRRDLANWRYPGRGRRVGGGGRGRGGGIKLDRSFPRRLVIKGTLSPIYFLDNFEKPKYILITGDPQFSETIIKCVWLRITRTRMAAI